jgi:hypothetical protein
MAPQGPVNPYAATMASAGQLPMMPAMPAMPRLQLGFAFGLQQVGAYLSGGVVPGANVIVIHPPNQQRYQRARSLDDASADARAIPERCAAVGALQCGSTRMSTPQLYSCPNCGANLSLDQLRGTDCPVLPLGRSRITRAPSSTQRW